MTPRAIIYVEVTPGSSLADSDHPSGLSAEGREAVVSALGSQGFIVIDIEAGLTP